MTKKNNNGVGKQHQQKDCSRSVDQRGGGHRKAIRVGNVEQHPRQKKRTVPVQSFQWEAVTEKPYE